MSTHETVLLSDPMGAEIEIDKAVAPMVKALWDIDIETYMSCENWRRTPGQRWIVFTDAHDAVFVWRWLDKLYHHTADSISLVITGQDGKAGSMTALTWQPYADRDVLVGLLRLQAALAGTS